MASGHILRSNIVTPLDCLHYALSLPTSVVITGIDSMPILKQAVQATKSFSAVTQNDIAAILKKTKTAAARGEFEPFQNLSYLRFHSYPPGMAWL